MDHYGSYFLSDIFIHNNIWTLISVDLLSMLTLSTTFRFWLMPATVLRSIITAGLETDRMDLSIGQSVDFMEERLSSLDKVIPYYSDKILFNQHFCHKHRVLSLTLFNHRSGDSDKFC